MTSHGKGWGCENCAENLAMSRRDRETDHHLRDSNLKDIVLDQLLAQHDDAELDAQLHEAASRSALQRERRDRSSQTLQKTLEK